MVVVVPRLSERERREPQQVARLVVGVEAAAAEEVAQRVDAVGHVVHHEQAHTAAPEQPGERSGERAADRIAEGERGGQPAERPDEEGAVHEAHDRIVQQVGRVAVPGAALGVDEQPADVGVHEPVSAPLQPPLVADVRAVRVALLVGEGVVLAVVGDPRDHGTLDRRRAEHRQDRSHRPARLEAAVSQVAMEADGDAPGGERVHDQEHGDVAPVEQVVPELPADDPERDEWEHRDRARGDAVRCLVLDRLDVVGRWCDRLICGGGRAQRRLLCLLLPVGCRARH